MRVAPEAYYLFDAAAVGVPELCDAFKVRLVFHGTYTRSSAYCKTDICTSLKILLQLQLAVRHHLGLVYVPLPGREALLQGTCLCVK